MVRLGLMMIVKNEAHVIERCLRSVLPLLDWWVVADTGSTDGTQDLVRSVMGTLPGELIERPWVDFGHNRQEALDAARGLVESRNDDYVLWIDADETLVDLPSRLPDLTADGYQLQVEYDAASYGRLCVVRLGRPWRWSGVIHEHLDLPGAAIGNLESPRVFVRREGSRALDPDTYRKDAAVISRELTKDPANARLQFYLGQSWRDAGEWTLALAAYEVRAANPHGWDQERWFALFQVARCREVLQHLPAEVSAAFLSAYAEMPARAEPLVELARHERQHDRFEVAVLYAREATRIAMPGPDALFVDRDAHGWQAWDELAVSCYWSGRDAEGLEAAERALAERPDDERLQANVGHFRARRA